MKLDFQLGYRLKKIYVRIGNLKPFILFGSLLFVLGCASQSFVFENKPPVNELGDMQATSKPSEDDFDLHRYLIYSTFRNPMLNGFDLRRVLASQDVNSMDEVPRSSWYTPRLGYQAVSKEELVHAAQEVGPPQKPVVVTKVKTSGTAPGFYIKDARGEKYLLKIDAGDFPGLESMTNYVVSRLFWGFGYNVPEDYSFPFLSEDLSPAEGSSVTRDDIEATLFKAFQDDDGYYQATASFFIKGSVLGHIAQNGVREDDPNDLIAHENRRVLRALHLFCAWLQNTGIRSDNTLDVYHGKDGEGFTKHYMLDFGEALGVHGLGYSWKWDGEQHYFSWAQTTQNILNFGILKRNWEKIEAEEDGPELYFESKYFDPEKWREVYQFEPIRKAQPDDDYWAAKIIHAVTEAQLRALFEASGYNNAEQIDYYIKTLLERREKIFQYIAGQVTALEFEKIELQKLTLRDQGNEFAGVEPASHYEVHFFDQDHRQLAPSTMLNAGKGLLEVEIPRGITKDYLRLEIRSIRGGRKAERAAEFHLLQEESALKLLGIVR